MRFTCSSEYSRTTGRSLLVGITLHDLGLADRSSRCSRLLLDWVLDTPSHPLVNFAPLQSLTHGEPSREATPLMRFGSPLTLAASGSDQHRACLTRLCSAFRLSQPLDALLLPLPFRLCFTPVAPMGFSLQRFSLPCCRSNLSADLPLLTLSCRLVEAPRFRPLPASEPRPSPKTQSVRRRSGAFRRQKLRTGDAVPRVGSVRPVSTGALRHLRSPYDLAHRNARHAP
jgi:hypothetical protein